MTGSPPPVDVTQADRDAAASLYLANDDTYSADPILHGEADNWPLLQAFARHRLTAYEQSAAMREALEMAEAEIARLKKPTLFWIDEDPETGYCDPWEAAETALYHSNDEGIAAIREGLEIGTRYYARLRPHADEDDDWTGQFDTHPEAEAGVAAERARRAALKGQPS